ncbi:MAG: hypothetical protein IJ932_05200 [Ruminococcus sp.]|nr:hypothetical protein [Ruminococcus sp.]
MKNIELLKLLVDKKVADAFQFFTSCEYKLDMAKMNYDALVNLISKYQSEELDLIKQVFTDARETGTGVYKSHKNVVDFFGIKIDTTIAIEKVFYETMGLLHSFFDTFAQWINSSLFGEKALPIKKASLLNVIKRLPEYSEYSGQFIADFLDIINDDRYVFVSDYNNTQKHRYQLYVHNEVDFFALKGKVDTQCFSKDGRKHIRTDVASVVLNILDYCKALLLNSKSFIESYYNNNDCNYVEHRLYNPKTYLYFENESDYKQMKNVKNHYCYIEVNAHNVLEQYQVMLVSDHSDADENEDKNIEIYNSIYPIIMLKDKSNNQIIGILKPEDQEQYKFSDEHYITYRRYKSITSDYQSEMFKSVCEDDFKCYPLLSEVIVYYGTD